jgi:hypothetical protein
MAPVRTARIALVLGLAGVAAAFAWVRSLETIVLHTGSESGRSYEASLWVADEGVDLWIEAPDAERDWYAALVADPLVEVERSGRRERFRAQAVPQARARVERLYREKYGVAHALLGWVGDRSRVIPIRLARMPDAGTRA